MALQDFGRTAVDGAAELAVPTLSILLERDDGRTGAEINELRVELGINQNVLVLDVPMAQMMPAFGPCGSGIA